MTVINWNCGRCSPLDSERCRLDSGSCKLVGVSCSPPENGRSSLVEMVDMSPLICRYSPLDGRSTVLEC